MTRLTRVINFWVLFTSFVWSSVAQADEPPTNHDASEKAAQSDASDKAAKDDASEKGSADDASKKAARTAAAENVPWGFMRALTKAGLHDPVGEPFNVYGQFTWISSLKPAFKAPYTNLNGSPNSLLARKEQSFTGSLTLFLGLGLWPGAEIYAVPEVITLHALSSLRGLGSTIQNFELQKTGAAAPSLYNSRLFIRQTIDFGGKRVDKDSSAMQLGRVQHARRFSLSVGNFSVLDFFDKNAFAADLRHQFFNMTFLTYAAYDFGADARGYTYGGVAELFWDDWALRFARIAVPRDPNQLSIETRFFTYYGDQFELEHTHKILGQEGVVRLLGYRNREKMARFDDAIAAFRRDPSKNAAACTSFNYGSENATAPDLCWARKTNVKLGLGLSFEQRLPYDIGVFFRGMYSDGETEVYSFSAADRSVSFGTLTKGTVWKRPNDSFGLGYGQAWISKAHAQFLGMGGVDGFIGDGKINWAAEHLIEAFYSFGVADPLWFSLDYQHIWNPAYNSDRGGVDIFGARLHAEF